METDKIKIMFQSAPIHISKSRKPKFKKCFLYVNASTIDVHNNYLREFKILG